MPEKANERAVTPKLVPPEFQPQTAALWRLGAEYSSVHADISAQRFWDVGKWLLENEAFQAWHESGKKYNMLLCVSTPPFKYLYRMRGTVLTMAFWLYGHRFLEEETCRRVRGR